MTDSETQKGANEPQNSPSVPSSSQGGAWTYLQAGHFYSAGSVPRLRFHEDNVHGQCMPCNYFGSGNIHKYRENLIAKIGVDAVEELDRLSNVRGFKWNRYELISIIEKYKGYK
jgi:hypothetical protein